MRERESTGLATHKSNPPKVSPREASNYGNDMRHESITVDSQLNYSARPSNVFDTADMETYIPSAQGTRRNDETHDGNSSKGSHSKNTYSRHRKATDPQIKGLSRSFTNYSNKDSVKNGHEFSNSDFVKDPNIRDPDKRSFEKKPPPPSLEQNGNKTPVLSESLKRKLQKTLDNT